MKAPFSRTLFELLVEQAEREPRRDAVLGVSARASYDDLAANARRVAGALHKAGIRRGDRIGLLADNRVEWLEIFFGISALGAVVVPFSTWSTASELDFLLEDSGVSWLFTLDRFGGRAFGDDIDALRAKAGANIRLAQVVIVDGPARDGTLAYGELLDAAPAGDFAPGDAASAGDVAMVLYTSGSSNRPKAVPLDQFATIENGFNIGRRQGLRRDDRVLVSVPLFWAYGAVNALPAVLSHGATFVLQSHFQAGGALDLIEQHGCTAIYTLPAMTNALLGHADFAPERTASLRTGVTIGAPQDIIKAAERLGAHEMCNVYGGTEGYGNCCVTPHDWPLERRSRCQGPPLPGVHVRIRNAETGAWASAGEIGQIEVKGYLTRGYDGQSAKFNAETFTEDGYFRTGDLGSMDETGAMCFAGRSSEMIKRSGINVSPSEVEEVLQRHPSVGLAGVTGVPDADRGEIIVGYVTAVGAGPLVVEDVLWYCREHLSRYKVPDRLVVADALPLTVTGKVMRRDLKTRAIAEFGDPA